MRKRPLDEIIRKLRDAEVLMRQWGNTSFRLRRTQQKHNEKQSAPKV